MSAPTGQVAPAAPDGYAVEMLRVENLPPKAKEVLAAQTFEFVPWRVEGYSLAERARAKASADEGLSVVRGHLRDSLHIDFAIAGRDKYGARILALLSEADGQYRVVTVSEGPELADSLRNIPAVYLDIAKPETPGGPSELIVTFLRSRENDRPEVYQWVASERRFLLVQPN